MAVFPLAGAPAPTSAKKTSPQLPVSKEAIAFAEALDGIRKTQPALFARLQESAHAFFEPESRHLVRVPPDKIFISQGRAQLAEDILVAIDNCTEIADKAKAQRIAHLGRPNV